MTKRSGLEAAARKLAETDGIDWELAGVLVRAHYTNQAEDIIRAYRRGCKSDE